MNFFLFYRTHNQIQKLTVVSSELEKPPPKKRGRKCRHDVKNENFQESIRYDNLKYNL